MGYLDDVGCAVSVPGCEGGKVLEVPQKDPYEERLELHLKVSPEGRIPQAPHHRQRLR